MGEYAKHGNREIKTGTCESMYYLRMDDRHQLTPVANSLNVSTTDGLIYRLPYPDEDEIAPGDYEPYNRGLRLCQGHEDWAPEDLAESPGRVQLRHPSGLLVSITCYHGLKLPEAGGDLHGVHWNGKTHSFELTGVKPLDNELFGVVQCRHCGRSWRVPLAEILDWVPDAVLQERLAAYQDVPELWQVAA